MYSTIKIDIKELTFKSIIGILPIEREKKQKVIVDIKCEYKFYKNTDDFVDYSKIAKFTKKYIKKNKFFLIEDAILSLKSELYSKFKIDNLQIKITKPDILKDCKVSVSIG